MEISQKVGHQILQRGAVIKSPSGKSDWVVVENAGGKVILACVSKYTTKSDRDLEEWYKIR
jgi:hypothetical protein